MSESTIQKRGRGRPLGTGTGRRYVQVTVSLEPALVEALDTAASQHASRSDVIRQACHQWWRRKKRQQADSLPKRGARLDAGGF